MSGTESSTKKCITCGDDLHPERAIKYDYCTGSGWAALGRKQRECSSQDFSS
jgi:hypothetical protein